MTASQSSDNTFVGIDVGGAFLDVAWHRGGSAQYANRPDAIATLIQKLQSGPTITRIVIEPTGGYERPLRKALRKARLPVEIIHPSRVKAYRTLVQRHGTAQLESGPVERLARVYERSRLVE